MQKKVKINMIILACFFLGVTLAIQLKSTNAFTLVSLASVQAIEKQVAVEKDDLEILKKQIADKKEELEQYSELSANEMIVAIEKSLNEKKAFAGDSLIIGEGIVLKISDSKKELEENENPNDLIIHDQDIIALINDLKIGGAEAIAINGERLMSDTEIKCSGATITINDKTYGQPFLISAIGEKGQLISSVMAPDSYGYLLVSLYSIDIEIIEKDDVRIPRFNGEVEYAFRKEIVQ